MDVSFIQLVNALVRKLYKLADGWAAHFWHNDPFGKERHASKERYLELFEQVKSESHPNIDALEGELGYALDKEWMDNLAKHTQITIKSSPLCYQHGRVLYAVLRHYLANRDNKTHDVTVIETGTARGFSSTIMARAIKDAGANGTIMTFDLLPHDTKMLWNTIDDEDEGRRSRRDLLKPWHDIVDDTVIYLEADSRIGLNRMACGRTGFAFLDGAHTYRDVMTELALVEKRQQSGDVIVFDDYSPTLFPGIVGAVDDGCEKYGYEKKVVQPDSGDRGYVIATKR